MRLTPLLPFVLTLFTATACQKTEASSQASTGDPPVGAKRAATARLDASIDCINGNGKDIRDRHGRYLEWVARAGKPDVSRGVPYLGLSEMNCVEELAAAIAMTPADSGIDDVARRYLTALEAAVPVLRVAHEYYDQKRYQDDGLARGLELHPKLLEVFEAFAAADNALHAEVSVRNRARKETRLAELEQAEGKTLRWRVQRALLLAEDLVLLTAPGFEQLDRAAYGAMTDAVDGHLGEMSNYAAAHPDEIVDELSSYSSVESALKDYLKTALALKRRLRDNKPYTQHEVEMTAQQFLHGVEGSVPAVVKEYNDMINAVNQNMR